MRCTTLKTYLTIIIGSFLFISCTTVQMTQDAVRQQHNEISEVLFEQQKHWNEGNIEKFMLGYWKDDQLSFIGKNGVTKGWDNTLANYKKAYPDQESMGHLDFKIIEMRSLSSSAVLMLGHFKLTRKHDSPSGYFSLIWEKLDGKWLITSDHTSG